MCLSMCVRACGCVCECASLSLSQYQCLPFSLSVCGCARLLLLISLSLSLSLCLSLSHSHSHTHTYTGGRLVGKARKVKGGGRTSALSHATSTVAPTDSTAPFPTTPVRSNVESGARPETAGPVGSQPLVFSPIHPKPHDADGDGGGGGGSSGGGGGRDDVSNTSSATRRGASQKASNKTGDKTAPTAPAATSGSESRKGKKGGGDKLKARRAKEGRTEAGTSSWVPRVGRRNLGRERKGTEKRARRRGRVQGSYVRCGKT